METMAQYVALLRGINVGGNNLIKMAELKQCFEAEGFENVATYINSGNVLFESTERSAAKLIRRVEEALAGAFGYKSWVALRSHTQMQATVDGAPAGFGSEPDSYLCDVIFLKGRVSSAEAIKEVRTRDEVDAVYAGHGVLYFSRLKSRATQSYINRVVGTPIYQSMTIRNWNTTIKLAKLTSERAHNA
jgi:uncharacterized protein (DUF1697 family)